MFIIYTWRYAKRFKWSTKYRVLDCNKWITKWNSESHFEKHFHPIEYFYWINVFLKLPFAVSLSDRYIYIYIYIYYMFIIGYICGIKRIAKRYLLQRKIKKYLYCNCRNFFIIVCRNKRYCLLCVQWNWVSFRRQINSILCNSYIWQW